MAKAKYLTENEVKIALWLIDAGKSVKEIADVIGRSEESIRKIARGEWRKKEPVIPAKPSVDDIMDKINEFKEEKKALNKQIDELVEERNRIFAQVGGLIEKRRSINDEISKLYEEKKRMME